MLSVVILLNLNLVVFEPENGRLVIIYVAIVGCTEDSDHRGELCRPVPLVQLVAIHLDFVRAHYTQQVIKLEKVVRCLVAKKEGTTPLRIL
jgi:hypothetical protein